MIGIAPSALQLVIGARLSQAESAQTTGNG